MKKFAIKRLLLTLAPLGASGSEHSLHQIQPFPPEQTRKRRWVTKHSHCIFRYPRDVTQVITFSTQLGLGSELVDWYRNATSVLFAYLLIDLSPRTDDRLRSCTNTGSIPPKFYIPDRLKQSKILDAGKPKCFDSAGVPIIFPQMQKPLPSVLLKRVYPLFLQIKSVFRQEGRRTRNFNNLCMWNKSLRNLSICLM